MDYSDYESFIQAIVEKDSLNDFKSNPNYNHILEHVNFDFGQQYLTYIKTIFQLPVNYISMFGRMNDSVGGPRKEYYPEESLLISPTSLRYIFHALLILQHMKAKGLEKTRIVEVGCGYGGLALALSYFSQFFSITIEEYNFVDLPGPLTLQEKYLSHFQLPMKLRFHSASSFGSNLEGSNYFLISNYCFSEIAKNLQENYLRILFPKCAHGFLTWNHIDVYDIGKEVEVQPEYPLTGSKNKYVRF